MEWYFVIKSLVFKKTMTGNYIQQVILNLSQILGRGGIYAR